MDRSASALQSLREKNKAATREAIAEAAMQLAMRRDIETVRNEDIAEAAGVSTRTFSNYFANKYEALSFRHAMRMRYAAEALRSRPAEEPLWDAIRASLSAPWIDADTALEPPTAAAVMELRLLFGNRAVQGEILKHATDQNNEFACAIAERLSLPPGQQYYARLLAAAATIVTQVAIDAFLQADPPVAQLPLVVDALKLLSEGFPPPATAAESDGAMPAAHQTDTSRQHR